MFAASARRLAGPAAAVALSAASQALHTEGNGADAAYLARLQGKPLPAAAPTTAPAPATEQGTAAAALPRARVHAPRKPGRAGAPVVDVAGVNAGVLASLRGAYSVGQTEAAGSDAAVAGDAALLNNTGGSADGASSSDDGGASQQTPAFSTDTRYLQALERHVVHQISSVKLAPAAEAVEIKAGRDAATIHREIAVVGVTRGCHPLLAEAVARSIQAAAAADTLGFRYYLITDATPDEIVEHLEKALHVEIPSVYREIRSGASPDSAAYLSTSAAGGLAGLETPDDGAVPLVAVLDRAAKTQRKFIMPPSTHSLSDVVHAAHAADAASGTAGKREAAAAAAIAAEAGPEAWTRHHSQLYEGEDEEGVPPMVQLLLASVPFPGEIADWGEAFAYGELKPSLLGMPRPEGDAYPGHPHLTQVVSESWEEIVLDPKRDVLLEAYLTHCPMCMCLAPRLRMLAYLMSKYGPRVQQGTSTSAGAGSSKGGYAYSPNGTDASASSTSTAATSTAAAGGDPLIRVAVMNVDDNERPQDWMPGPAFPTIQLFAAGTAGGGAGSAATTTGVSTAASSSAASAAPSSSSSAAAAGGRPWTKAFGPTCGPAAHSAVAALQGYGITVPHGHLPNPEQFEGTGTASASAGSSSTAAGGVGSGIPPHSHLRPGAGGHVTAKHANDGSSSSGDKHSAVSTALQAAYGVLGISGKANSSTSSSAGTTPALPPPHPSAGKLNVNGTPVCVPSVDFTHPTQPGKSALPSVTDLVHWLAAHCSAPFDPAAIRVPASELRHSRQRMEEIGLLPPPPPSAADSSSSGSTAAQPSSTTISLLELASDMDAESRAYETAVFDTFYYQSMLGAYRKACYGEVNGSSGKGSGGHGHGGAGKELEAELPPAYHCPLSSYGDAKARAVLPLFEALVARLKAVGVEGGTYGRLEETVDAMEAAASYAEEHGIRAGARAWLQDQAEGHKVAAAAKLAARLVVAEQKQGAAVARMQ